MDHLRIAVKTKVIGTKSRNIYSEREAVRLVISNDKNEIVLISVKKGNYCKLPGGGIEKDEDHIIAGEREALEETGCKVTIDDGSCMATTEEWRGDLHQISYCYCAHLVEDTGVVEMTSQEVEEGLKHEWLPVEVAMKKIEECQPTSEIGKFIKERDLYFLQEYSKRQSLP